ncbi:AAA family ATPase [Actinokineospora globicatena]|uniref:AAA family ATPase n=1 Tax=Actinokineospora globicatena TaxID=103729 RepID=UPI0020A3F376|nr:AAA family ATPase [Actinokineospora globicatena]MCP2301772.1 putative ATPase [Actinokineospora globicatena]GLW76570.1 hypothetical protein Aglo01_10520 [Actinokineospora globicatena]GLW83404.1 hypothetical protein Aglo02_10440 [Actinokineospora globicatena]
METAEISFRLAGYKAIRENINLNIKPLTLISGTNSSGKSSFMQPFLMLKQTLESTFDPGPLLMHGPNVQLTDWSQAFSRGRSKDSTVKRFTIGIDYNERSVRNSYERDRNMALRLARTSYNTAAGPVEVTPNMTHDQVMAVFPTEMAKIFESVHRNVHGSRRKRKLNVDADLHGSVVRNRCFLEARVALNIRQGTELALPAVALGDQAIVQMLASIIHVPGLRGNPERVYPASATASEFPGTMEKYAASLIYAWQTGDELLKGKAARLYTDLQRLGLTWKVVAHRVDDVRVELRVGRLPNAQSSGAHDLVNIADVGFGVSQVLPILVALHAAEKDQIVYIEQPEIHLHPKAQMVLGLLLVEAANRGVRVVAETHSSLLIRSVQTAIARRQISPNLVGLNWFYRDSESGFSRMNSAEIDEYGRFGDWPVDFDDVAEQSDFDFIMAVEEASK